MKDETAIGKKRPFFTKRENGLYVDACVSHSEGKLVGSCPPFPENPVRELGERSARIWIVNVNSEGVV